MKMNVGRTDQIVRIILAALLLIAYFTDYVTGTMGIVALVLAVVFIVTAYVRFCPIWFGFKVNTCKK